MAPEAFEKEVPAIEIYEQHPLGTWSPTGAYKREVIKLLDRLIGYVSSLLPHGIKASLTAYEGYDAW